MKALQRRAKACEVLKDLDQALEDLTAVCIIESFQNQATLVNVDRVLKELGKFTNTSNMPLPQPFRSVIFVYFSHAVSLWFTLQLEYGKDDRLVGLSCCYNLLFGIGFLQDF